MLTPSRERAKPISLIKAALLCLAMVLPFWPTWVRLMAEWTKWDQALAHGIVIALATLYYVFATSQLERYPQQGTALRQIIGVLITLAFVVIAALSQRVAMDAITQLALVALLLGLMLVFFPTVSWLRLFQVSGLLVFSVQAWGSLNDILLYLASEVVGTAVAMLSIPALIDGNSITLPYGIMLIADGCSGLRYFIIALALGWLLSISLDYRLPGMFLTLAVATALALIMNWIRIYLLILVGYYSEMQHSLVQDHELFGWVLFAIITLPAMYFAPQRRLKGAA